MARRRRRLIRDAVLAVVIALMLFTVGKVIVLLASVFAVDARGTFRSSRSKLSVLACTGTIPVPFAILPAS